jgi:hypothetical protein
VRVLFGVDCAMSKLGSCAAVAARFLFGHVRVRELRGLRGAEASGASECDENRIIAGCELCSLSREKQ